MTDTRDKDNKPGGNRPPAGGRRPLGLGKPGGGRPNFNRAPAKTVVVERKKRRLVGAPGGAKTGGRPTIAPAAKPKVDEVAQAAARLGLSKEEYVKRQAAVGKAQAEKSQREEIRRAEEAERQRRAEEDRKALEAKKAEEEARRRAEEAEAAKAAHEAQMAEAQQESRRDKPAAADAPAEKSALELAGGRVKRQRGGSIKPSRTKGGAERRRGKLTIATALAGDDDRQRSLASMRRARQREKERRSGGRGAKEKVYREVVVPEAITVSDLANRMSERAADVVKFLMKEGTMAKMNDVLDADTAQLIVEEFGHTVKRVAEADVEDNFIDAADADDEKDLKPRAPVIAVMGHVDHGKTSLLDALRATDVASGEAGGITQHIGAYQLKLKSGETITVLDTPGHAAFSAMRTRGAEAVDIVILVVAADDGVKPQTIESIKYARGAQTPIIVAINKMDAYEANPDKIEQDLLQYEVITESMSGDVQVVKVSAKEKTGLQDLAEAINMQAELMELKANPKRKADGLVIESKIEKGRGPVATLLVKRGALKRGDVVVAGDHWGKVKALVDERGKQMKTAGPSEPVEILGLDGAPAPGEPFGVVSGESKAREITEYRVRARKQAAAGGASGAASMEQMLARLQDKTSSEMTMLVKADVQGSFEAIRSSAEGLGNEEVKARVIGGGVGGINESDIMQAKASNAPVIGFNVRANRQAKALAEKEGVEIRYYSVIYDLLDDVRGVLEGMLEPEKRETFIGYAEILEVFNISKLGKVAGCKITEGKVERGAGVRLLRDDVVIHEGELSTLKRFKDEVEKVNAGMECGMGFAGYHDLRKGDQIECFTVEYRDRKLEATG